MRKAKAVEIFMAELRRKPGAFIYIIHPCGNFTCKYSVLQLVQTQNGKTRKCTSINWKVQKEKKKCIDEANVL